MEKEKTAFQKLIEDANKGISHKEFVEGAKNGTIGFKVTNNEPNQLLSRANRNIFNLLAIFHTILPLIIVPIFAYKDNNWWLLFGIPFSYIGSFSAASKKSIFIFLFTCLAIGVWFKVGFSFYQYISFYYFSALWGYLFFKIADQFQFDFAMKTLVTSPEVFNNAIEHNKIIIIRKNVEDLKKEEDAITGGFD